MDVAGVAGRDRNSSIFRRLEELDWDFADADTRQNGHNVHPYPAKFPPQLPAQLIAELTKPGDLVVDPFGGSGTAILEATRLGREAFAIDANPVAVNLARFKVRGLDGSRAQILVNIASGIRALFDKVESCCQESCTALSNDVPEIKNVEKWFAPSTIHELAHVRQFGAEAFGVPVEAFTLALGQAASKVSFQDSETRYVSVPRQVQDGEAITAFGKELKRIVESVVERSWTFGDAIVVEGDARSRSSWKPMEGRAANLIVTSPPYPNAYDYHLYHRFRLLWTGADPTALKRVEIGSHLRQQSLKDPIGDYEADMRQVLKRCFENLHLGGWCVFVVGDGKYRGEAYLTGKRLALLGAEAGLEHAGTISRNLPSMKRSVTSAGRRLATEQLVIFRKFEPPALEGPNWRMAPYEVELAGREFNKLTSTRGLNGMKMLTFSHAYVDEAGRTHRTQQGELEISLIPNGSTKKVSTYASHGIHRYKGKFYPQLGRCLINLSCTDRALVVDPFAGSGTLGLEATLLGHDFHGIELSPVAAQIAGSKSAAMRIPSPLFKEASVHFENSLSGSVEEVRWEAFDEAVREELESWFAPRVLARISRVLTAISSFDNTQFGAEVRGLARVCLSDLVNDVSHQDPTDLRIRRRAEPLRDAPVEAMFLANWSKTVYRVGLASSAVDSSLLGHASIVQGDASLAANWSPSGAKVGRLADAVISSPPYAAALPYLDTDRLRLAAVFGTSKTDRKCLEDKLVGSREITSRLVRHWTRSLYTDEIQTLLPASTTSFLQALDEAVSADETAGFRRKNMPAVLARYFCSMGGVIANAKSSLRMGGHMWLVLGDSVTTVAGEKWTIPTTAEVCAVSKMNGFDFVEQIPITVTRDGMRHSKNAITKNSLLHFIVR